MIDISSLLQCYYKDVCGGFFGPVPAVCVQMAVTLYSLYTTKIYVIDHVINRIRSGHIPKFFNDLLKVLDPVYNSDLIESSLPMKSPRRFGFCICPLCVKENVLPPTSKFFSVPRYRKKNKTRNYTTDLHFNAQLPFMSHLFYKDAINTRAPRKIVDTRLMLSVSDPSYYRTKFFDGPIHNIPDFYQAMHPDGILHLTQRNVQVRERQSHSWVYLYDTVLGFFRKIKGSVQPFKPCVLYLRTQTANILM